MTGVSARTDESVRALLCQLIRLWRCRTISKQELQINEEIRDKELRVIDSDGTQLGIMPLAAAQKIAVDRNLDLVKIAPQATPPVCRVMDYGKYRFEESKREREARKNQKTIAVKEIRLSLNIFGGRQQAENRHPFSRPRNGVSADWTRLNEQICRVPVGVWNR